MEDSMRTTQDRGYGKSGITSDIEKCHCRKTNLMQQEIPKLTGNMLCPMVYKILVP